MLGLTLALGLNEGDTLGLNEDEPIDGEALGLTLGLWLGLTLALGLRLGLWLGLWLGL
jgi:hypothetical protein